MQEITKAKTKLFSNKWIPCVTANGAQPGMKTVKSRLKKSGAVSPMPSQMQFPTRMMWAGNISQNAQCGTDSRTEKTTFRSRGIRRRGNASSSNESKPPSPNLKEKTNKNFLLGFFFSVSPLQSSSPLKRHQCRRLPNPHLFHRLCPTQCRLHPQQFLHPRKKQRIPYRPRRRAAQRQPEPVQRRP